MIESYQIPDLSIFGFGFGFTGSPFSTQTSNTNAAPHIRLRQTRSASRSFGHGGMRGVLQRRANRVPGGVLWSERVGAAARQALQGQLLELRTLCFVASAVTVGIVAWLGVPRRARRSPEPKCIRVPTPALNLNTFFLNQSRIQYPWKSRYSHSAPLSG